jgi:hypothetical protein
LGLRSERIFELDACNQFLNGAGLPFTPPGSTTAGTVIVYLSRPMALQDMRMSLQNMQDVLKATEADDWPAAERQFPTRYFKTLEAHPITHLFGRMMGASLDRAAHVSYSGAARSRLAVLALAIHLYAVDHDGKLPASLDELTPRYLPAVPVDPLSGQPLHYIPGGNAPCVYSVGDDGVDDHGTPAERKLGMSKYGAKGDIVVALTRQARPAPATQP